MNAGCARAHCIQLLFLFAALCCIVFSPLNARRRCQYIVKMNYEFSALKYYFGKLGTVKHRQKKFYMLDKHLDPNSVQNPFFRRKLTLLIFKNSGDQLRLSHWFRFSHSRHDRQSLDLKQQTLLFANFIKVRHRKLTSRNYERIDDDPTAATSHIMPMYICVRT